MQKARELSTFIGIILVIINPFAADPAIITTDGTSISVILSNTAKCYNNKCSEVMKARCECMILCATYIG